MIQLYINNVAIEAPEGTTILAAVRQAVSPETQVTFSPDGSLLAAAGCSVSASSMSHTR